MDDRERSIIAAHEIGHAICGRIHGDKRKVEEISLFAHGEALGVTVSSQEDNDLPSETDLRARLVALMGGRAAEELLFHEVTGGAGDDFDKANRLATIMVTKWGMGRDPEAADGGASGRGDLGFLVASPSGSMPSGVQAASTRAIRAILDEAYESAYRTLVEHVDTLRRLASYLVEHERLDGETFNDLFEGRIDVPRATEEWRPTTSRPRAWDEVAVLADRRFPRVEPAPVAIAASQVEPVAAESTPGVALSCGHRRNPGRCRRPVDGRRFGGGCATSPRVTSNRPRLGCALRRPRPTGAETKTSRRRTLPARYPLGQCPSSPSTD